MIHTTFLSSIHKCHTAVDFLPKRKNQDLQMRGSLSLPPPPLSLSRSLSLRLKCAFYSSNLKYTFDLLLWPQRPNNVPTMSSYGWPWGAWADECLPDFVKIKRLTRREADGFLLCTSASTNFNESLQNLRAVFLLHRLANSASDVGGKEANFSTNMIGDVGGRALLRVLFTHKIAPGPQV